MLKRLIRKWLEIDGYAAIDARVRFAIEEILNENDELGLIMWDMNTARRLRGVLLSGMRRMMSKEIEDEATRAVRAIVDPEIFIDRVVERIRSKQVG